MVLWMLCIVGTFFSFLFFIKGCSARIENIWVLINGIVINNLFEKRLFIGFWFAIGILAFFCILMISKVLWAILACCLKIYISFWNNFAFISLWNCWRLLSKYFFWVGKNREEFVFWVVQRVERGIFGWFLGFIIEHADK